MQTGFNLGIKIEDAVGLALLYRRSTLSLCKKLLSRLEPKLVMLVVSYKKEMFVGGCKTMKVSSVELGRKQQSNDGIVYKLHPSEYTRWRREYPRLIRYRH